MGFIDAVMPYVQVLLPTIVLALIFWFVMKGIFNADRREREAEARADAEYAARVEEAKARRAGTPLPDDASVASAVDAPSVPADEEKR